MDARSGRFFAAGVILATLLWGCVSAQFAYKWYYPNLTSYNGTLQGPKPTDDIQASACAYDPVTKEHGCVVMLKKDFTAMYTDYLDLQNKLNECESPK